MFSCSHRKLHVIGRRDYLRSLSNRLHLGDCPVLISATATPSATAEAPACAGFFVTLGPAAPTGPHVNAAHVKGQSRSFGSRTGLRGADQRRLCAEQLPAAGNWPRDRPGCGPRRADFRHEHLGRTADAVLSSPRSCAGRAKRVGFDYASLQNADIRPGDARGEPVLPAPAWAAGRVGAGHAASHGLTCLARAPPASGGQAAAQVCIPVLFLTVAHKGPAVTSHRSHTQTRCQTAAEDVRGARRLPALRMPGSPESACRWGRSCRTPPDPASPSEGLHLSRPLSEAPPD